jgi:hypothetical protein
MKVRVFHDDLNRFDRDACVLFGWAGIAGGTEENDSFIAVSFLVLFEVPLHAFEKVIFVAVKANLVKRESLFQCLLNVFLLCRNGRNIAECAAKLANIPDVAGEVGKLLLLKPFGFGDSGLTFICEVVFCLIGG